jgi:hypothetical protein
MDVFQGNHLQQRYTPWKESAQKAITSRKAADYQTFDKKNAEYKTSLELMLKQSGNPDWQETPIAKNLTLRDHVCLAAGDIDGDGKVEVAAGAQWNPGETNDKAQSGAVFFF